MKHDTILYRDFEINGATVSYSSEHDWIATHKDYDPTPMYADDGPSDHRYFVGRSVEHLKQEIDEWWEDQE